MDLAVGLVGVALAIAVVVWFFTARTPRSGDGVDRPGREHDPAERSTFGPAGPGAEAQAPPLAGGAEPGSPPP
jgi:hypothetical protein